MTTSVNKSKQCFEMAAMKPLWPLQYKSPPIPAAVLYNYYKFVSVPEWYLSVYKHYRSKMSFHPKMNYPSPSTNDKISIPAPTPPSTATSPTSPSSSTNPPQTTSSSPTPTEWTPRPLRVRKTKINADRKAAVSPRTLEFQDCWTRDTELTLYLNGLFQDHQM